MVETKSKPKTALKKSIKNGTTKAKESKTDIFFRLAKPRVEKVLDSLRILSNCSNRSNYEYTQEQVKTMFESIQLSLDNAKAKFTPSKSEQVSFEF